MPSAPKRSSTSAGGGAVGRHCDKAKEAEKITYVSRKRVDEIFFATWVFLIDLMFSLFLNTC